MELLLKIAANNFLKPQNCVKNLENLAIWDKLPDFILENFATALVKLGQFQILKNDEGDLSQQSAELNMWLMVNHIKPTNTLY